MKLLYSACNQSIGKIGQYVIEAETAKNSREDSKKQTTGALKANSLLSLSLPNSSSRIWIIASH
jgi:hypothetical protein